MSSLRELRAAKLLRRADLPRIRLDQIHVQPGFNPPESPEDWEARVESIVSFLAAGGKVPPIEVLDRPEGGVWLVEGHARTEATLRALDRGLIKPDEDGFGYLLSMPFEGDELDRLLRPVTSATGRNLSPIQQAHQVKKARDSGASVADIARRSSKSVEYISQLLALSSADEGVLQLVTSGQVSALVAAKAVRKHKGQAKAVLEGQLETVKAKGKTKVTATVAAAPVTASAPAQAPGFTDTQRLDFMIKATATVVRVGDGYAVVMPGDDERERFDTGRQALDAFMTDAGESPAAT